MEQSTVTEFTTIFTMSLPLVLLSGHFLCPLGNTLRCDVNSISISLETCAAESEGIQSFTAQFRNGSLNEPKQIKNQNPKE